MSRSESQETEDGTETSDDVDMDGLDADDILEAPQKILCFGMVCPLEIYF
jgi:hypothetical protein